jgi:hypothetical protein
VRGRNLRFATTKTRLDFGSNQSIGRHRLAVLRRRCPDRLHGRGCGWWDGNFAVLTKETHDDQDFEDCAQHLRRHSQGEQD